MAPFSQDLEPPQNPGRFNPAELVMVADGQEIARHVRGFERHQTHYNYLYYLGLVERKPGALRNGAPFADMPEPLVRLQQQLLKQDGGDRVMAQVWPPSRLPAAESAEREVRSVSNQMKVARFPAHRDLAGFDFSQARVDEELIRRLHTGQFLASAQNVVFIGGQNSVEINTRAFDEGNAQQDFVR
jgi:hypothetical protein